MAIFTTRDYELLQLITSGEFEAAYQIVLKLEEAGNSSDELKIIKMYLLVEMESLIEAERIYKPVHENKFIFFLKRICFALNNIVDYFSIEQISIEDKYECAILENDYVSAKKHSISLLNKLSIYLVFALILSYHKNKQESDAVLLNKTLEKTVKFTNIFILMAQLNVSIDFVIENLKNIEKKDFTYFYLLELIYKKYPEKQDFLERKLGIKENLLLYLIDKTDSWDLYEIALEKSNFNIKEKDSLNYKMFKLKLTKDISIANELIRKTHSFDLINKIGQLIPKNKILKPYNLIFELPNFKKSNLKIAFQNYENEKSFLNFLILLAHLIASKNEQYLVLALFLTKKEANTYEDYEIKLIHIFLLRFFLFQKSIYINFEELSIKSIQHESMAFIWNDIYIKTGLKSKLQDKYHQTHLHNINVINNLVMQFITHGKLDHAYDLLKTKEKLLNSKYFEEFKSEKILCCDVKNEFSLILGESCSWLFDKLVVNCDFEFKITNLFSVVKGGSILEYLKNDLMDLTNEFEFISWVEGNYN